MLHTASLHALLSFTVVHCLRAHPLPSTRSSPTLCRRRGRWILTPRVAPGLLRLARFSPPAFHLHHLHTAHLLRTAPLRCYRAPLAHARATTLHAQFCHLPLPFCLGSFHLCLPPTLLVIGSVVLVLGCFRLVTVTARSAHAVWFTHTRAYCHCTLGLHTGCTFSHRTRCALSPLHAAQHYTHSLFLLPHLSPPSFCTVLFRAPAGWTQFCLRTHCSPHCATSHHTPRLPHSPPFLPPAGSLFCWTFLTTRRGLVTPPPLPRAFILTTFTSPFAHCHTCFASLRLPFCALAR